MEPAPDKLSTPISGIKLETHGVDKAEVALLHRVFGPPRKQQDDSWIRSLKIGVVAGTLFLILASPPVDEVMAKYVASPLMRLTLKVVLFFVLIVVLSKLLP